MSRARAQRGVTLIEVLVAVTLLSLLSLGMLLAMRIGLDAFAKTDGRLMYNRRVAGAQRLVEQELEGMMPIVTTCGNSGMKIGFFQGGPQVMRLVSSFSLAQAWRGQPQILEMFIIPGEYGRGVRLVVNEIPYTGPANASLLCVGMAADPVTNMMTPRFAPVNAGPASFVLADKLAYCHFSFLSTSTDARMPPMWRDTWGGIGWPMALRIDMAPLEPDPTHLQPISVVAPFFVHRSVEGQYADF